MIILCPTDFSEHSVQAVKFAAKFAKDMKAELQIMTAYQIYRNAANFVNINEMVKKNYEEDLNALISKEIKKSKHVSSFVAEGSPVNAIIKQAKNIKADLIVMGTQGSNSVANVLFGSITKKLVSRSEIPVLAIPMESDYSTMKSNLLLTFDGAPIKDLSIFNLVMSIAEAKGSMVEALHVSNRSTLKNPFENINENGFGMVFHSKTAIKATSLARGISEYLRANKVSIVVMVRRKKGFLEKLLFESHSDENLLMLDIPMLILKEKE